MSVPKGPLVALFLLILAGMRPAQAQLKIIQAPPSGKIAYGPATGMTSEAEAMGAVLRSVHQQFGQRPQVGKLFQVRGTNSVAVYFMAPRQGQSARAGLLIVAGSAPDHLEVAVLSDDAPRFGSSINPMLKTLMATWHPGGTAPAAAAPGPSRATGGGKSAPLRPFTLPDRSASVSLPDGWTILPGSGGGSLYAKGPNGESASLGFPILAANSPNGHPQLLHYPYGRNLATTFVDLTQMLHKQKGVPPAIFEIASEEPVSGAGHCSHILGKVDEKDGNGMKEMNTIFCSGQPQYGTYLNLGYYTVVPVKSADQERATMAAVLGSYNINMAVVNGQATAIAKPAVDAIHAIGKAAADRAAVEGAAHDRYNRGVEERWDAQARSNQQISNYTLDQTVIEDRELNAHGTLWNQTADSLVRNNPERYGYVDKPNFWKGIDY